MKNYGGLARFILHTGEEGVAAIRNMEKKGLGITLFNLRSLEMLMTPKSKDEVLVMMRDESVTLPKFDQSIRSAVHNMWAGFYWHRAPYIHADKGISP